MDPYLFLRAGEALSGDFLHENDDIQAGANTNSRITATLAAGTYTIEATTYDTGVTGDFTLTISGLGGGTGGGEPTSDGCGFTITADGATSGTWAPGCESSVDDRGYAKYYTFTLDQQSGVTIDLESDVDTYLYLRSGNIRTGPFLYDNDDVEPGSDTDSQISESLAAGTYTIEATTYAENQTGSFTLTISGLTGTVTTDPDSEPDTCGDTLTADGSTSGTWAAGCDSGVSGRGYARYYTFTLGQESTVTITLESDLDTFLYLRSGDAQSGDAIYFNDDIESGGVNLNSRISESLAVGTYTIEATTYSAGETGSFTLSISGLSGDDGDETVTPPGETESAQCDATPISADGQTTGTWADDCQSQVAGRGYAKYYALHPGTGIDGNSYPGIGGGYLPVPAVWR